MINGDSSTSTATAAGGTATLGIGANFPGSYRLTLTINRAGVAIDTVPVSFTTVGRPASIAFTPASSTTPVNGPAPLTVAALDAQGNPTQLATSNAAEYVTLSATSGGTASWSTATSLANSTPAALSPATLFGNSPVQLGLGGTSGLTFANNTAGVYTLTATPNGVLGNIAAKSVTVLVSGSIGSTALDYAKAVTPTNAVNGTQAISARTVTVPSGSATIKIDVADTTLALANTTVRLKAVPSAGAVNGSTTAAYVNVTLDRFAEGSATFLLSGAAVSNNSTLTITQVTAANAAVSGFQVTVTQQDPAVGAGTIYLQPSGAVTAALGSTVPVAAQVLDQFDNPYANYTVRIYRTSISNANLVSSGTTGPNGVASLTVTNATAATAGTTETYITQVQSPAGVFTTGTTYAGLSVTYTATGAISLISAATNPATTASRIPAILVPTDGLVNTAVSGATYTAATDTVNNEELVTEVFTFTPLTSPATNVVITAPEGVKLSLTAPNSVAKAWDGGSGTLTVPSGTTVYAWSTKTDIQSITMVPFGQTAPSAKVDFLAFNLPEDGYKLTATPAKQEIGTQAFGTVLVSIFDVFGNPVAGSSFNMSAEGPILISGQQTASWFTNSAGVRSVAVNSLRDVGLGKLTVTGSASLNTAWAPGYVKPPRVPADPSPKATVEITVSSQANKSIVIVGSRTTVSGKPGIKVDGIVTGIENGKTVTPFIRFPGQTTFTEGSARPVISNDEFTWQRKTGKRVTVYVSHDGVDSNRVVIQAK